LSALKQLLHSNQVTNMSLVMESSLVEKNESTH